MAEKGVSKYTILSVELGKHEIWELDLSMRVN